jgi:HK97 family phage major capsid protein
MTAPTAVPTNPAEWEEYVHTALSSPEAFKAAFDSGDFKKAMLGYRGATNKTMTDIKAQLSEEMQASVLELFQKQGNTPEGRPNFNAKAFAARKGAGFNDFAPGAQNKVWQTTGQMLSDILTPSKALSKEQSARLDAYQDFKNAYSEKVPSEGGFLIPEELRAEVLSTALETAIVRPKAQVVPLTTGRMKWPVVDFTTEVGEVFGGIIMSWLDEGQTIPETSGTFAALELIAHKLGGLASPPNELVRDAAAFEAWLRSALPAALAHFEDIGFLTGDGVKKPLGALSANNPALIVVNDEGAAQQSGITWLNVLGMVARMLPDSFASAEWIITPDALPEIFTMALPVGTGGSAVMVGEGTGSQRLPTSMLGMPITWSRKAPAVLGTQGDISLVDNSKYVIGDTMAVTLDASEHSSFRSDKTDFRVITRVDGQPGMTSALTPQNNGPTLSAWIQLATRTVT